MFQRTTIVFVVLALAPRCAGGFLSLLDDRRPRRQRVVERDSQRGD